MNKITRFLISTSLMLMAFIAVGSCAMCYAGYADLLPEFLSGGGFQLGTCALTTGYNLGCRDSKGGISEILICEYDNLETDIVVASGEVAAIDLATGKMFRKYQLEVNTGSLTEQIQTNVTSGTVFWEQDVTFPIHKLSAVGADGTTPIKSEIKLLAMNRLLMIVKDRNGVYWLVGMKNGANLQPSISTTGTAMADMNGYTLNFKAFEEDEMPKVSSAIIAGLLVAAV